MRSTASTATSSTCEHDGESKAAFKTGQRDEQCIHGESHAAVHSQTRDALSVDKKEHSTSWCDNSSVNMLSTVEHVSTVLKCSSKSNME